LHCYFLSFQTKLSFFSSISLIYTNHTYRWWSVYSKQKTLPKNQTQMLQVYASV
jgi:hypothetical protein